MNKSKVVKWVSSCNRPEPRYWKFDKNAICQCGTKGLYNVDNGIGNHTLYCPNCSTRVKID
jgi:hypothetical protein